MKKLLIAILMFVPLISNGQGQIYTRRTRLQGYENKITKVVSSGNIVMDALLSEEIIRRWVISPYEFCTDEDYERLKEDGSYFFLRFILEEIQEGGNQLVSLQYLKAGPQGQQKQDAGFEVLRLALGYYENGGVPLHNLQLLSSYVDIIQNYVVEAALSERVSYFGPGTLVQSPGRSKKYYFSQMDISASLTPKERASIFGKNVLAVDEQTWQDVFRLGSQGDVVGVVIAPVSSVEGSTQVKMVIGADDHKLYYYSSSRIRKPQDVGFQASELGAFSKRM